MKSILIFFTHSTTSFIHFLRIAIFIVTAWIGGLKVFPYEADGIVPFVISSPFMSFFFEKEDTMAVNKDGVLVKEYNLHKNPEGLVVKNNINWHTQNGTYVFSYGLGLVICSIGVLVLLGIWYPKIGFWGGILTFGMSIVTLSFLITTPEVYVPNLGGDFPTPHYGFPYLSGAGRLVLKDIIMMGAGLIIAAESAKQWLKIKTS